MPCLIEAFKQMRRRGLLAKRACYCEDCGPEKMLKAAKRLRSQEGNVHPFVHVGEWDPSQPEDGLRVPLLFGWITDDLVTYHDPTCVAVGDLVAVCLQKEGIPYEWDRTPGSPILVIADESLSGIPASDRHHAIPMNEDHEAIRVERLPERVFDQLPGNPVRLLNVAKVRRINVKVPYLQGPVEQPRVGDHVKLGFLVSDAIAPQAREEFGEMVDRIQTESMWVEVTSVRGRSPQHVYRGELTNRPMFLDPAKIRIGSPVNFTVDQIYPVVTDSPSQMQR